MKMATELKLIVNYLGLSSGLQKSQEGKDHSCGINEMTNHRIQRSEKGENIEKLHHDPDA